VTQLDEVGLDGVFFGKPVECFVERLEVVAEFGYGQLDVVKVLAHPTAAVLGASFAASVLHEDPPHGLGRGSKEVPSVVPALLISRTDHP
jgi:hypothetical protein